MRIFNRTRKFLLKESNPKNYLKYALGEIVLVVAGILIALQINNWNESRKIKKNKLIVSEIIKESFLKNKQAIEITLNDYQINLEITELRIKNTGPQIELPSQTQIDSIRLIDMVNLKLANDLQSTILIDNSSLSLLGADIRELLLDFLTSYQEYKLIEDNVEKLVIKLRENHQKHISLLAEITPDNNLKVSSYNRFDSDYRNWLRDPVNQNVSVEIKWKMELALSSLKDLEEKNTSILEIINTKK